MQFLSLAFSGHASARRMAAAALAASMLAAPAFAQSTKDRVEMLEQAVSELRAGQPAAADAALRLGRLEQEIQRLTGEIEELEWKLEQSNARLAAVTAALSGETPIGDPGQGSAPFDAAVSGAGPTDLATGDPIADRIAEASGEEGAVSLPLDSEAAFDYASSFLLRGDYPRARQAFQLYVEAFPNSPRTADAQFRLGEIHLATGANAEAADAFIAHIKKYPNDPRAAEAYLKLGAAFSRLGNTAEACRVFKAMKAKFPNADPAILTRANAEMAQAQCR